MSFVNYTVLEFGKFGAVPAACSPYKVAGDSLKFVNVVSVAFRAFFHIGVSAFVSAVHASVPVMVDRTVSDIVFVHQVHD